MKGGHFVHALCRVVNGTPTMPNVAYVNKDLAERAAKGELPTVYKIKQIWVPFEDVV